MKKFYIYILIFCFVFLACSCVNNDNSRLPDASENDQGTAEVNSIKESVLKLMSDSESQQDPAILFSHFDGDFEISGFTSSMDNIKNIKRKNAVTVVSAANLQYYGVEAAGFLFYAADFRGESEVIGVFSLQNDAPQTSTVFTAFGIDTGVVYTNDSNEEPIELTAEMLTVSEDEKTCTFSKQYVDQLATVICDALGYTESQKDTFMEKYQGSGVYSVEENKITFEIKLEDNSLGNITQITSYSVDADQNVNAYSLMEYSNPSLGINTPTKVEIHYQNVVYQDDLPVSATISVNCVSDASYYDGNYQGAPYITATDTINATYTLDCSDQACPKGSALYEKTTESSFKSEKWTNKTTLRMSVDLSKSSAQFSFTEISDGETVNTLKANKVVFATPSGFPAVPQRVTNSITNYINKHF